MCSVFKRNVQKLNARVRALPLYFMRTFKGHEEKEKRNVFRGIFAYLLKLFILRNIFIRKKISFEKYQ